MLDQLTISGGACFGSNPLILKPLQRVNFFFGPNGSGKTTISRALAGNDGLTTNHVWHDGMPLSVRVYNRDFVSKTLRESNRIPGVFVVGPKSVDAETRIEAIEGANGERAHAENSLGRAETSLEQARRADDEANAAFLNAAWDAYKSFTKEHPSLAPAFTGAGGVGNSKQALADRLLALSPREDPTPTIDSLNMGADAVFATNIAPSTLLSEVAAFESGLHRGYGLLSTRIVGSETVTLSELVAQLGNSDWVANGQAYLHKSDGVCPFCQQVAPANLAADLASMFDDHYAAQCAEVEALASAFEVWRAQARSIADAAEADASRNLDQVDFQAARRKFDDVVASNSSTLVHKMQTPSEPVAFDDMAEALASVNAAIESGNAGIRAHNQLIANRRAARPRLIADCWRYLAEKLLGESIASYRQKQCSRANAIKKLTGKVAEARESIAKLDREVRELHRSITSTRPVIDQINGILERSGFTSFKIVESPSLADGYMLSRGDGEVHEQSLSEGERTFIAFLYYFHLLDGHTEGSDEPPRMLAVVDDPISSLDSDVLFVVGTLIRQLIARAASGEDRLEQLIVLTHNVYFHKEITHVQHGESASGRTFFLIRKRPSTASTVESSRSNPVETEYGRLWAEVRRAIDGEAMNIIGLENILRRILESYFRVMGGGIWSDEIAPLLNADERHVFRALFRWVNEGSHSILEDTYYSPSPISQDVYLEVFARVFVVTKHEAHYRMMLHGKKSLIDADLDDSLTGAPR